MPDAGLTAVVEGLLPEASGLDEPGAAERVEVTRGGGLGPLSAMRDTQAPASLRSHFAARVKLPRMSSVCVRAILIESPQGGAGHTLDVCVRRSSQAACPPLPPRGRAGRPRAPSSPTSSPSPRIGQRADPDLLPPLSGFTDATSDAEDGTRFSWQTIRREFASASVPITPTIVIASASGRWHRVPDPDGYQPLDMASVDNRWQRWQRALAARLNATLIIALEEQERRDPAPGFTVPVSVGEHVTKQDVPAALRLLQVLTGSPVIHRSRRRRRSADQACPASQVPRLMCRGRPGSSSLVWATPGTGTHPGSRRPARADEWVVGRRADGAPFVERRLVHLDRVSPPRFVG